MDLGTSEEHVTEEVMLKLSWVMNSRWPEDEGNTQLWKKSWDDRESSLACMEQESMTGQI